MSDRTEILSPGGLAKQVFTLTSAQIKTLRATPVTIFPGVPGAIIIPHSVSLNSIFGTITYFNGTGNTFLIYYHGNVGTGEVFVEPCADTIEGPVANTFQTVSNIQSPKGLSSFFIGQGLDMSVGGGVGEEANGDGTLTITIEYTLLTGQV